MVERLVGEIIELADKRAAGFSEQRDAKGWPLDFFEKTYGCLADDPIARAAQGEFEVRKPIE